MAVATLISLSSLALVAGPASSISVKGRAVAHTVRVPSTPREFPIGSANASEPSGVAPPSASSVPGYVQSYVNDFTGTSVPSGWDVFTGAANGDPGSQWGKSHVTVANGMMSLNTWKDSSYANEWVTGGLCQCGVTNTYGAYFVRSRETGSGPTVVELLWPVRGWPPEIDFNETSGVTSGTSATIHWGSNNAQSQVRLSIDMTQWHTWGVVWTPNSVYYTVDGTVWGSITDPTEIPQVPMTLNLQQQTWCSSGFACPTSNQSTQIDWVAEYTPSSNNVVSVGPFMSTKWSLTGAMKHQITMLAQQIQTRGDTNVSLTASSVTLKSVRRATIISRRRAQVVEQYLEAVLARLHESGIKITASGSTGVSLVTSGIAAKSRTVSGRVVARIS